MLKPTNYNYNATTRCMFTQLPTEQNHQFADTVCCPSYTKCSSRTIAYLPKEEESRLKTTLAHMDKIAMHVSEVRLAERSIKEIEGLSGDKETKNRLLELPQLITKKLGSEGELLNALKVLSAILIKDSFNFDQPTRQLISDFIGLTPLGCMLDELCDDGLSLEYARSFRLVYNGFHPAYRCCAFFSTSLEMNKDGQYIPVFAFSSKHLKPCDLRPKLEKAYNKFISNS